MKTREWMYQEKFGSNVTELRNYLDSDNPYRLIEEAKEAREMLASHYVAGFEFARSETDAVKAYNDPSIKFVCSIGAVFYVQGHQSYECNLIRTLNKSAGKVFAVTLKTCEQPDCNCEYSHGPTGSIVDVNDTMGREAALKVFDHAIASYQTQIDYAESFAATYRVTSVPVKPFTYTRVTVTPPATPININTPVEEEVYT